MGLFDRFKDFGDREMVKTNGLRGGGGLQQLQSASDRNMIQGLSFAIAQDVQNMLIQAAKLTPESTNSLKVTYRGNKIAYTAFLDIIRKASLFTTQRGGLPLI